MSGLAVEQIRKGLCARSGWFAGLPAALQTELVSRADVRRLQRGGWLYGTGDAPAGAYAVLDGLALIYVPLARGDDVLVHVAAAGEFFGHAAQLGHGPRLATVMAARNTSFLYLSEAALQAVAEQRPELWQALTRLLYRQLGETLQFHAEQLALPLKARLARRLLQLCPPQTDTPSDAGVPVVGLSQSLLAELLGSSRRSLNQALQQLVQAGLVSAHYRSLQVLDREGLARIAAG